MEMERIVYLPGQTAETQKCPVGMYHVFVGTSRDPRPSDVACPYCKARLIEICGADKIARVVQEFDRTVAGIMVGVEFVPETHRVLQCRPCLQVFTMPKENA